MTTAKEQEAGARLEPSSKTYADWSLWRSGPWQKPKFRSLHFVVDDIPLDELPRFIQKMKDCSGELKVAVAP